MPSQADATEKLELSQLSFASFRKYPMTLSQIVQGFYNGHKNPLSIFHSTVEKDTNCWSLIKVIVQCISVDAGASVADLLAGKRDGTISLLSTCHQSSHIAVCPIVCNLREESIPITYCIFCWQTWTPFLTILFANLYTVVLLQALGFKFRCCLLIQWTNETKNWQVSWNLSFCSNRPPSWNMTIQQNLISLAVIFKSNQDFTKEPNRLKQSRLMDGRTLNQVFTFTSGIVARKHVV